MPTEKALLDIEAWRQWRERRDPESTSRLIQRIDPIVKSSIGGYLRGGSTGGTVRIPPVVIQQKARNMALQQLDNYDPSKAQINTYLTRYLNQNFSTWANKYQNLVRIPSGKSDHISKVREAADELEVALGRAPSNADIAAKLKLPEHHIEAIRFQTAQKDYLASPAEVEAAVEDSPFQRAFRQTYTELPTQHRAVADLWLKQNTPAEDIRNMMNLSRSDLKNIQEQIRENLVTNHTGMS